MHVVSCAFATRDPLELSFATHDPLGFSLSLKMWVSLLNLIGMRELKVH